MIYQNTQIILGSNLALFFASCATLGNSLNPLSLTLVICKKSIIPYLMELSGRTEIKNGKPKLMTSM